MTSHGTIIMFTLENLGRSKIRIENRQFITDQLIQFIFQNDLDKLFAIIVGARKRFYGVANDYTGNYFQGQNICGNEQLLR